MNKYASTTIKSKWRKTKWMLRDSRLRPYIPETLQFSKGSLQSMLKRHTVLYFKPTGGSGGNRIIRIVKTSSGAYRLKGSRNATVSSVDALYHQLKSYSKSRGYLLQKGINLENTNGRPFDIRVMVQKPDSGKWRTTALFTKIGRQGKVVNNYNQGGKVAFLPETLRGAGYSAGKIDYTTEKLSRLGENAGYCFDRHLKGFRELGLDVAIDKSGRYWILETNTRPQFYPLRNKMNKSAYRRILKYAKQYGRYK